MGVAFVARQRNFGPGMKGYLSCVADVHFRFSPSASFGAPSLDDKDGERILLRSFAKGDGLYG